MWAFLCCKVLGLARHPTDNFSTDCSFLCTRTQFKWYKTLVLAYFVQISIKEGSIISGVLRRHLLFWDSSHLSCQHWVYLGVCVLACEKLLYFLQSGPGLSIPTSGSLELEDLVDLPRSERLSPSVVLVKTGTSCLSNVLKMSIDLEIYIKSMVIP